MSSEVGGKSLDDSIVAGDEAALKDGVGERAALREGLGLDNLDRDDGADLGSLGKKLEGPGAESCSNRLSSRFNCSFIGSIQCIYTYYKYSGEYSSSCIIMQYPKVTTVSGYLI